MCERPGIDSLDLDLLVLFSIYFLSKHHSCHSICVVFFCSTLFDEPKKPKASAQKSLSDINGKELLSVGKLSLASRPT